MIEAYLDESGIHDGASVCVIAGYFGHQRFFGALERNWRSTLSKFGVDLKDFHANEFVKAQRHKQLVKELSACVAAHRFIHPISFGIVVNDFNSFSVSHRKFFTGATLSRGRFITSGSPSKPYFVPFQLCIRTVTDHTPKNEKAQFFFGLDRPFAGYVSALFNQMKLPSHPISEWLTKDRIGDPAFPLASETPQLQAADLLVHLTYLHMLERLAENNWDVQPSGNLRNCLRNACHITDHAFQDKDALSQTLKKVRTIATATSDWSPELDQGIV